MESESSRVGSREWGADLRLKEVLGSLKLELRWGETKREHSHTAQNRIESHRSRPLGSLKQFALDLSEYSYYLY